MREYITIKNIESGLELFYIIHEYKGDFRKMPMNDISGGEMIINGSATIKSEE